MRTRSTIALLAREGSVLNDFLIYQLKALPWIDCLSCTFDNIQTLGHSDLCIVVLENMGFDEVLNINAILRDSGRRALFVFFYNGRLVAGPTYFPGSTAGADSAILLLKQEQLMRVPRMEELSDLYIPAADPHLLQEKPHIFTLLFSHLVQEVCAVLEDASDVSGNKLKLVDSVTMFNVEREDRPGPESKYIYPVFEGFPERRNGAPSPGYRVLLSKYFHSKKHIESNLFAGKNEAGDPDNDCHSIAIIGGGTSGFLTALALKKEYPELDVVLIESSKIPVIGVGEATTPEIRRFLFHVLELPTIEFYKEVKPTWKLGIKFFWGLPGDYYFNYPFGRSDIRSAYLINGNINDCSLSSMLMSNDSSFVVSPSPNDEPEQYFSLSNDISYALHLDNVSFIGYLKTKAIGLGVRYIDDLIIDAVRDDLTGNIASVIGEGGDSYSFDYYVDCSGFKSLLIEKVLESPYLSYKDSLFNDRAVTGCIPNKEKVRPYTYAESMDNGWCWAIPMRGEDHRGYVFSSDYCTEDEAARELKLKNPDIENFRVVKFKSGRHREICMGNVFAVGNSYAFVEPLESTGIHMIIKEVELLVKHLPNLKKSPAVRKVVNDHMNAHWDYLKGFLSIHYKFNNKFKTRYWQDCRNHSDISSIQWLVDLYNEVGLLSYTDEKFREMVSREIKDDIFGLLGFDTLLLGQGVIPKNFDQGLKNKSIWMSNVDTWRSIQSLTIPLEKDLKVLIEHPELI